jgi:3-hydroxyisobutyrate dehydrogenase-like beta-hydroxyacid dehydrogenase
VPQVSETIAFLGTGFMGAPMAGRLAAAGYGVKVWNRAPEKAEALRSVGATPCLNPKDAVTGAAFVCLCLTNAVAADELLFGPHNLAAALDPAAIVIDFSTSDVARVRDLAARVAAVSGAAWLDAPVSGGVAGAQAGTLAIFAGGDSAVVERAQPLLSHLAGRVTHMGGVGSGQATKLCNQLIAATTLAAIAEAIALGDALGIDTGRFPEAVQGGFADSRPLQLFGRRMAAAVDPGPTGSALKTMFKDITAIREAAAGAGLNTPLMERVDALYRRFMDAGLGEHDLPVLSAATAIPAWAEATADGRAQGRPAAPSSRAIIDGRCAAGATTTPHSHEIVSLRIRQNAAAVVAAAGGSTKAALHLPAIADEAGIYFGLGGAGDIFIRTPVNPDLKPGGCCCARDLHEIGGVPTVLSAMLGAGVLHQDRQTVSGQMIGEIALGARAR